MKLPKDILSASVSEKLEAIATLWNSIDLDNTEINVSAEQQDEAKRRLANIITGKSATISSEELKKRIANRYGL